MTANFAAFSNILDGRILRALADMGFARPTLVQEKAIPLALQGRDILARARTGSGKTAAYCIPVLQKVIGAKTNSTQATKALILVPTRELSEQVAAYLRQLVSYCKEVGIANVSSGAANQLQRTLLADNPDIVIATPSRALALVQSKALSLSAVESLVIDEADLIFSYGHDDDIRQLLSGGYLPKVFQSFLMSATMTEDVESLKGLALHSPAILKLEEGEDEAAHLSQYVVRCSEVDKFLLTYVILKLKLVKGKCLIFVNDVERSYRLKLFLEQFSIKSCVLNSELPLNSRYHAVQEFNKGVYDYIIATDESGAQVEADSEDDEADEETELISTQREPTEEASEEAPTASRKRKRAATPPPSTSKSTKRKHKKTDGKEYGVTRGVDFVDVACVLNFDLPTSSRSYTHRVGRTARAGRTGMSLSFVVPQDQWGKNKVVGCVPSAKDDENVFSRIEKEQAGRGSKIKIYEFDMKQVEAFRYRMDDALRSVTRSAIKEARIKELKTEILTSEKLKAHFEDNPLDLEYLRHDKPLHPTRIQAHMKHVPKYLLPRIAPVSTDGVDATDDSNGNADKSKPGFVPFRKEASRGRGRGRGGKMRGGSRGGKKKSDPLRNLGVLGAPLTFDNADNPYLASTFSDKLMQRRADKIRPPKPSNSRPSKSLSASSPTGSITLTSIPSSLSASPPAASASTSIPFLPPISPPVVPPVPPVIPPVPPIVPPIPPVSPIVPPIPPVPPALPPVIPPSRPSVVPSSPPAQPTSDKPPPPSQSPIETSGQPPITTRTSTETSSRNTNTSPSITSTPNVTSSSGAVSSSTVTSPSSARPSTSSASTSSSSFSDISLAPPETPTPIPTRTNPASTPTPTPDPDSCPISTPVPSNGKTRRALCNALTLNGITRGITQVPDQGNSAITYTVNGGWPDSTGQDVIAIAKSTRRPGGSFDDEPKWLARTEQLLAQGTFESRLWIVFRGVSGKSRIDDTSFFGSSILPLLFEADVDGCMQALLPKVALVVQEAQRFVDEFGILHKDLHPGNVLWDTQATSPTLIDWGLAEEVAEWTDALEQRVSAQVAFGLLRSPESPCVSLKPTDAR
ncbi:hypothetical protein ONZ45_g12923 [Pleurotus djamor]|nr:hypothetical protein ONZ45_g12923 [Pleurotus djamor]